VKLEISSASVADDRHTGPGPHYEAVDEEIAAYEAGARRQALEAAEIVHATLTRLGMEVTYTTSGAPSNGRRRRGTPLLTGDSLPSHAGQDHLEVLIRGIAVTCR